MRSRAPRLLAIRGTAAILGLVALSGSSHARPLELHELERMEQYLLCAYDTCAGACEDVREAPSQASYQQFVECEECLDDEGCGHAPRLWEKDGSPPVTMADHELAVLEQLEPDAVCYADDDETIVRPMALCPGQLCEARMAACLANPEEACQAVAAEIDCRDEEFGETCWYETVPRQGCPRFLCEATPEVLADLDAQRLCADDDADGTPAWAEDQLAGGGAPTPCTPGQADACPTDQVCAEAESGAFVCQDMLCDAANPCGFFQSCARDPGTGLTTCETRGACEPQGQNGGSGGGDEVIGEICDPAAGACVECLHHGQCANGERCASGTCVQAASCTNSLDCAGSGQVCDTVSGYCVGCVGDAECAGGEVCSVDGTCVTACSSDLQCTGAGLLCDTDDGHCVQCTSDDDCAFDEACVRGTCRPTSCSDGTFCHQVPDDGSDDPAADCPDLDCHGTAASSSSDCTAFHLEKVAEDDTEVLVHVYYDFTPVPARVMDLHLEYDDTQLTLEDARPLAPLELEGKELASTHMSDGTLVLSVYDDEATHPIPNGPIIELVFRRTGVCPTEISFTDRPELRQASVAPLQGSDGIQDQLADDALWGPPVVLCARDEVTPRLRLWYGFETQEEPLAYSTAQSADELCEKTPECALETDDEVRARYRSRLADLQAGDVLADESIQGVARNGAYFDGSSDHMRMPVHYAEPLTASAQSFSMSTWFYTEGNSDDELATTPQVLYSHNAYDERTAFGLMSLETGDGASGLALYYGDLLDPRLSGEAVLQDGQPLPEDGCATFDPLDDAPAFWVAQDVPLRTWHHVGFSLDADFDGGGDGSNDAKIELYWDGEYAGCVVVPQPPDAVACPQLTAGTDVKLHEEGDVLGGRTPEFVYLAVNRSNLYRIERMDPGGLQSTTVIGDKQYSYQDPDYSPILDKLVFSSNASGDYEIWIADGDGSNRRQLTVGFGDADRGITARRPRWAPDGSGIVFDSNVYDELRDDNSFARVRHVYYMGYDPVQDEVAVELADGSTTDQLDYDARVADQTISDHRLTSAMDRHHRNARWLTGERPDQPDRARGALLIDTSKDDRSDHRVQLLTVPQAAPLASTASVPGLGVADDVILLDAHHEEKAAFPKPVLTERALIKREDQLWEVEQDGPDGPAQFHAACGPDAAPGDVCAPGDDQTEIALVHTPAGYDPNCWDANFNAVKDADEDRNGDGVWDVSDCNPSELDLYVSYDAERYTPVLDLLPRCTADRDCDGGRVCVDERCEVADDVPASCQSSDDCPDGTLCTDGECKAVAPTVLTCSVAADCFPGTGQICRGGQCVVPGEDPRVCLEDSDCAGEWICSQGRCVDPAGGSCDDSNPCDAGRVCVGGECMLAGAMKCGGGTNDGTGAEVTCGPAERCEAGACKVLGRRTDAGLTNLANCVLHEDCDGGQRCVDGACVAMTGEATCTSDDDCDGGTLCDREVDLCRPAVGAVLGAASDGACELDRDCDGGQICDVASGTCKAAAGAEILSEPGQVITDMFGKKMELSTRFADVGGVATAMVRVEVTSPQSAAPVPAGEIVRIRFEERASSSSAFTPQVFRVRKNVDVAVKDLTSTALPEIVDPAGTFEQVRDGAFSPDGDRLLLGAISNARPILLRTAGLTTALDAQRITVSPVGVKGMDWVRQQRLYPCNWAGGYLHLQSKAILYGFRGGLDDMKVYSGLRDPDAIRSEAERGFEFLEQNGLAGQVESKLPTCGNSHAECPAFHLCIDSECKMVPCDPEDPWSCAETGGRCTLRPQSVEQENTNEEGSQESWDWVCAADCTTDNQCFSQACLNGPCRFCDQATLTCVECRETVQKLGAIEIAGIEGCPDRRSFACEAGACVTDCYSFEDGESVYLCDPTTEYCDQGRCALLDWDWGDLAPATFAGLGQMRRTVPPDASNGWHGYTQAVDQRIPVEVRAYGVEDWLKAPEMVVEVRGGPFYGSEWRRIGKIRVHNRTRVEANNSPYELMSPRPFNDMRLRLVTSPYENATGAATGLREHDDAFCVADYLSSVPGATKAEAAYACSHLAQGSRYTVGAAVGVTTHEAIADCRERGHAGCPVVAQGEHDFLQPGQPAVAVLDVRVDGAGAMNNITSNRICSYEGGMTPVDEGAPKKITYGRFGEEISNQADAMWQDCGPSPVPDDFRGLWTGDGEATASSGSGSSPGDGVANLLTYAAGRVGEAFEFDAPSDYLSLPPEIVAGTGSFTFETWLRTGDVRGGLLSIFERPESCADWKERGRSEDGAYTIWPDVRPVRVYCAGMEDAGEEPRAYIDLARTDPTDPGANVSVYRAGGGSLGTPVRTRYDKVRFDPESMTVDIADGTFAEDNGGRVGHACGAPADPADPSSTGCFRLDGGLRHLWRGEYDTEDAVAGEETPSRGVEFETGRIGQALSFGPAGGRIVSDAGLPVATDRLTVEGWIRTSSSAPMVIARQGTHLQEGAWELSMDEGMLLFTVYGALDADGGQAVLRSPDALGNLDDDTWHHVAVTLEASSDDPFLQMYVDGALVLEQPDLADPEDGFWSLPPLAAEAPVVVGQGRHGARAFHGAIDDLGIWSTNLSEPSIGRMFELGAFASDEAGAGYGKCLPEEADDLDPCTEDDFVTTLPFGVAYACEARGAVAEARIDLRGTPFAVAGTSDEVFASSGQIPVGDARIRDDGQVVELIGGGSCGGVGPDGWSDDPTATPPETAWVLPVRVRGDVAVTPDDCDADCLSRTADEALAVDLTPDGLEVRVADRVHVASRPEARLHDFRWHHVAVVRSDDALDVWVDGESWLSTKDVPYLSEDDLDGLDRLLVGQDTACAFAPDACDDRGRSLSGRLDEIALYDRALSMEEIRTIVDAGPRGRPVEGRPGPECPDADAGLVEFDRDTYGYALLNCNYYDSDPTGASASVDFQNIVITKEWPAKSGAIVHDDGDTCLVEVNPALNVPCHAWTGADVTLDPHNDAIPLGSYVPFQSLEVSLPRSFGHDGGFESLPQTAYDLDLQVTGLGGSGQAVGLDWQPRATSGVVAFGGGSLHLADLMTGRDFDVRVTQQPEGFRCGFLDVPDSEATCGTCVSGTMEDTERLLTLDCAPLRNVAVSLTFFDEEGEAVSDPALPGDVVVEGTVVSGGAELQGQRVHFGPDGQPVASASSFDLDRLEPVDGQDVEMEVVASPPGWSCAATPASHPAISGDVSFVVRCEATDRHPVRVEVVDLASTGDLFSCDGTASTGLALRARGAGEEATACVDRDGVVELADVSLLAGESWELAITRQPIGAPPRVCGLVEGETGVMPAGGLTEADRPRVVCTEPTNVIAGEVVNLRGPIELALVTVGTGADGQDQSVASLALEPEGVEFSPPPIPFSFQNSPLADGVTFRVVVAEAPEDQTCEVIPVEFTTPMPDGAPVVVNCQDVPEETYSVGGTVDNLTGEGLRLGIASGAQSIDVQAGASSFAFTLPMQDLSEYEVYVDRQPDGQFCEVAHGTGTVQGADVTDVQVTCENLVTVRVTAQTPAGYGHAHVRAFLVRTGPGAHLAGRVEGVQAGGGTVVFDMEGEAPVEGPANVTQGGGGFPPIEAGSYSLFVTLSTAEDDVTGEPAFVPGASFGVMRNFTISSPLPAVKEIGLSASEFGLTTGGQVTSVAPGAVEKDDVLDCVWSPASASAPVPPFGDDAPIFGSSRWRCDSSDGCPLTPATTTVHDPLPPDASLDVTCWVDAATDADSGSAEPALSHGDFYGHLGSVSTGSLPIFQVTVPLATYPLTDPQE
ncbi:MAG: LamG-like jellyroll fold domain-containing protein [Myxococcota bacterium]